MKTKTNWLVKVGMLSAISFILMLLEFPLPFIAPPFYEMDFSEVPVLIGAFALGPLAGVTIEFIKVLLNLLLNGTITAGVGEAANFLIGASYILPAAFIYRYFKTKKGAILGMTVGSVSLVVLGGFLNYYVLIPTFGKALHLPMDEFVKMGSKIFPVVNSLKMLVLVCVVPFNALKVFLTSLVTGLIYKHISPILKSTK